MNKREKTLQNNPWGTKNNVKQNEPQQKVKKPKVPPTKLESGKDHVKNHEARFKEVRVQHLDAAKKLAENYESSSDEEELTSGEQILETVFKSYTGQTADLIKTQQFLENIFQSGTATCLICIGSVKRADEIWSCEKCFTFFHLQCVQRWANDSISQKQIATGTEQGYYNNLGVYVPKKIKPIVWDCPKCRATYSPDVIPRHYTCFCGKEENPQLHPWHIPHSCGETCQKKLQPECGHKCVLLCHPGPCPPCPQIISLSCKCGESNPKAIRCTQKSWTCAKKCVKKLACGIHECGLVCHSKNVCPPCNKRSVQKCVCGGSSEEKNCSQSIWKCKKVCGKLHSCRLHKCEKVCHANECGDCPFGEPRSCPCGKQLTVAPCSEQVESCGDTCFKLLPCEIHHCAQRCHKGDCGQCSELTEKKCRCGLHSKELPCSKLYTCEVKCKRIRECKKHPCNRKCCEGQCPPCDKICGKTLSCSKHKCQSLCHNGPCYPCNQKSQIKCRCSNTVKVVPCGRERKSAPPKCMLPCKIPSKCHHENPHHCHQNECPTCIQKCHLQNDTTNCQHLCEERCHDAVRVLVSDKNFKPALPWEFQIETYEIQKLPHPECNIKVSVVCLGGHEKCLWPCWNSKPTSCQRLCSRNLKCGNHKCQLMCHSVTNLNSVDEEETCLPCQEGCQFKRADGCIHSCKKPCHLPPCSPCTINVKTQCHCGLSQVYYKCGDFNRAIESQDDGKTLEEEKEKLLCCGGRCIKNYPCGHQCKSLCHSGKCPNSDDCKKKVKQTCPCKNYKIDVSCDKIRNEGFTLKCNESCEQKKKEIKELAKKKELDIAKQEEERNRIELEEFERKYGKKKSRPRKKVIVDETNNNNLRKYGLIIGAGLILISGVVYFFVFKNLT